MLTSVLRFVRLHSEEVHVNVVQSSMNIICALCHRCEPYDDYVCEWVESLTEFLNHENYDVVVKKALEALSSIFERFMFSGRDLCTIATNELISCLSKHLYKACGTSFDIHKPGRSFYYCPPFLELAQFYSVDEDSLSKY